MPTAFLLLLGLVVVGALLVLRVGRRRRQERRARERLRRFVDAVQDGDGPDTAASGDATSADPVDGDDADVTASDLPLPVQAPDDLPTFSQVGGMGDLKASLRGTVGLVLAHRDRARDYQVAFNGLLLHGPPGSGKSHLARAVAGEFGMSLIHVSTGDLVEGVIGASARNVARAFDTARAHRPCVLFLDEFDSIAQRRESAGHAEERRTVLDEVDALGRVRGAGEATAAGDRQLTQLLTEIDGLGSGTGVLVLAATNRPDVLDPALTRGGRLARTIELPLPDATLRLALLRRSTARMPTVGVDLHRLAKVTDGMSGADLRSVCQQAAIRALVRVREHHDPDAAVEVLPEDMARAVLDQRA